MFERTTPVRRLFAKPEASVGDTPAAAARWVAANVRQPLVRAVRHDGVIVRPAAG
jgi:hypothetical protein